MSFALSKLFWAVLAPGSLLVFLLLLGCVWGANRGRALAFFVCACFLSLAVLPVGEWALTPLENRFAQALPDSVAGIIVLGGDEQTDITQARGVPTALDSLRRYLVFGALARRYPEARLMFSGGSPYIRPGAPGQDSEIARALLSAIGMSADNIVFETESRNTYENAVFSAALAHPDPAEKWVVVTSAWHMPRAIGCFRKAGWNVVAAPAGYFTTGTYPVFFPFRFDEQLHLLTMAAHEYVGLVSYWLMGRTSALWPD